MDITHYPPKLTEEKKLYNIKTLQEFLKSKIPMDMTFELHVIAIFIV